MTQRKKFAYNTIASLLYQVVALISGFILPHYILKCFGSEINGLVTSITQFLNIISLAECGIGAVVQSALYEPLSKKSYDEISGILVSAEKFFRNIGLLFIVYTVIIAFIYPNYINNSFGTIYTVTLIVIIAVSIFIQYFFSISYSLLLEADALAYITLSAKAIVLVLNTVVSIILIKNGSNIHLVKFFSSIVFVIQPIIYHIYVNKHYKINKKIKLNYEPIKQKWNGLAQHLAANILSSTDTIVLSIFSSLENVSIYSVYYLVVSGVRQIILALTSGFQPLMGNLYYTSKKEDLIKAFNFIEWFFHTCSVFLFTCTTVLIVPFIKIYTSNIANNNYINPTFGSLLCFAIGVYCIRLPYNIMVLAAGHYKQTQMSSIIEAVINIVASVFLVINYGLIGVALGTLAAMVYRTVYLAYYLSKEILYRNIKNFIKHVVVDLVMVISVIYITSFVDINSYSYILWTRDAMLITIIGMFVCVFLNVIFYKNEVIFAINKIKNKKTNKCDKEENI